MISYGLGFCCFQPWKVILKMAAVFFITKIKYKFFYWMVTFSKGLGYRCTVVAHQTHQKWPGNTLKFNFNILNMAEYSHVQVHSHVIGLVTRTCLKKLLNLLIYTRFLMVFDKKFSYYWNNSFIYFKFRLLYIFRMSDSSKYNIFLKRQPCSEWLPQRMAV